MKTRTYITTIIALCLCWSQGARATGNFFEGAETFGDEYDLKFFLFLSSTTVAVGVAQGLLAAVIPQGPMSSTYIYNLYFVEAGENQSRDSRLACAFFIEQNLSTLRKEISQQRGPTLDGLMELLEIDVHMRPAVVQQFAKSYSEIFETNNPNRILNLLVFNSNITG